ncbi:MAG: VCBS repeat-containing protein [Bacteroidota bacterium]
MFSKPYFSTRSIGLKSIVNVPSSFIISILVICTACGSKLDRKEQYTKPLFTKLTAKSTNIDFENQVENTEELNIFEYRNFYNGGGVGIGDINNDGLADVVFTANQGSNKIYLNQGNFQFKDITATAGLAGKNKWSTGVTMVDINADGWLDIYISNAGIVEGDDQKNELYINNKDLTFTEAAKTYNLADNGFTTHAAFFDYDKDGDLDVYLLNNSFVPVSSLGYSNKRELRSEDWAVEEILKGGGDKLLRNDDGRFIDVSKAAGIYGSLIGFGLGITVGDINGDNWVDIYVSNDFFERDYLYINQKDGTFSEEIENWTSHISLSSMGADLSDLNNDGRPDLFVTDMLVEANDRLKATSEFERYDLFQLKQKQGFHKQYMQNTLQLNNGNSTFSEIAYYAGVAKTDWSWSALLFDMDNDGHKDIYVSNGIYHDVTNQDFMDFFADDIIDKMIRTGKKTPVDSIISRMPSNPISNYAFKNNGNLTFSNTVQEWGFNTPSFSNGSAFGDLDNDGDLDLVVNNVNQPSFIYRNESNQQLANNYLQLKLLGSENNTFGIGSTVNIYTEGEIIHQQLQPARGFQSSVDYVMTIGLGQKTSIDSLVVIWADDSRQVQKNVAVNQMIVLEQQTAKADALIASTVKTPSLLRKTQIKTLQKHEENTYVDFDHEGLTYKMLSKEGPVMTTGDVDKDGLEDIFIGGAQGQAGQIYLQKDNDYIPLTSAALSEDSDFEDTAAAFFDANEDGYLDLLVGSGGNQVDKPRFDLRLYLNDKQGNFTKSELQIPRNHYNTAVIAPYDFDLDGDVDVFIGNRSVPGWYGMPPKHFLLENDGLGNFRNVLNEKALELKQVGMITSAQWADMDKNGTYDLVIAEDWGGISIFTNQEGYLSPLTSSLNTLLGEWCSLALADMDNDGDMDIVLGNSGTNAPYKEKGNLLKMYINDFDNNGKIEQILTTTFKGKDVPVHLKRELTHQMPILKKDNIRFSDYAQKSIEDLFPQNKLERAVKKTMNTFESVVALNNGDNTFKVKPLPTRAQFSCINVLQAIDLNQDGYLDLLFGGNDYSFKPQFSQLDASHGGVLLGDGTGNFQWKNYEETGFFVNGAISAMEVLNQQGRSNIIVGINDASPVIYELVTKEKL